MTTYFWNAPMLRDDYLVSGNAWHFPKLWKTTEAITLREFPRIVVPRRISPR
jgi:hypothetical protein